jgi:hypothetical protein
MRRAILPRIVLACLALVPAFSARAEESAKTNYSLWREFSVRQGSWTFVTENDKYFAGTDRHYTNGLKVVWLGETSLDESEEFIQGVAELIPTLHNDAHQQRYKLGLALGQNIYTPGDTDTLLLQPDDRPYAGWLYASMLAQAQEKNGDVLRVVELSLGMVGPSALGQQFQNGWHDVINAPHAAGWENQLQNEPGLILSWERRYRVHTVKLDGRRVFDVISRGRLTLGNVHTHLAAGAKVRLGWNLPADFGADLIRPAGGAMANADDLRGFSAHVYLSAEARAVAQNIFLDGNTWRDSHSVRKRPVIGDFSGGLVFTWPKFQITYTQDMRTKEFYGQDKRDVFGSIALTFFR